MLKFIPRDNKLLTYFGRTQVYLQARQDGGATEWKDFSFDRRQTMEVKRDARTIMIKELIGESGNTSNIYLMMRDFRVTAFEEFENKFVIVLRNLRKAMPTFPIYKSSIGQLFVRKRHEISIRISLSDSWNERGREIVRHCFHVTEPFKASSEYKGKQLKSELTLLLSKFDSPPPFQNGKHRTSRYNPSGMVEEIKKVDIEEQAAKNLLEENMGTELAGIYWDSWEKKRQHSQELKMFKDRYDLMLRDRLPQTQKRYEDYAQSLGMKLGYYGFRPTNAESSYLKALEQREEYVGNINNTQESQNSRKLRRIGMNDESSALQTEGGTPSVVEDADLWKWS